MNVFCVCVCVSNFFWDRVFLAKNSQSRSGFSDVPVSFPTTLGFLMWVLVHTRQHSGLCSAWAFTGAPHAWVQSHCLIPLGWCLGYRSGICGVSALFKMLFLLLSFSQAQLFTGASIPGAVLVLDSSQPSWLCCCSPGRLSLGLTISWGWKAALPLKLVAVGRLSETECTLQSCPWLWLGN